MSYNSKEDTSEHIKVVQSKINTIIEELAKRAESHDKSKLEDPEKEVFDVMTPLLAGSTYGTDEYRQMLAGMKPALDHHYANNRHHPEHFEEEMYATFRASMLNCMNLIDIIEMFCDWKAATLRHNNGDINKSIEINKKRFNIDIQLESIFKNTVKYLNW